MNQKLKEIWKDTTNKEDYTLKSLADCIRRYTELDEVGQAAAYVWGVINGRGIEDAITEAERYYDIVEIILDNDSDEDFAEYMLDIGIWGDLYTVQPGQWFHPLNYIDYEKMGRDLRLCGDYDCVDDPDTGRSIWYNCHY